MKTFGKDFWVGFLVLLAVGLMVVFAWLLGVLGPFFPEGRFYVFYDFAGGVEVGSPVRVSGVKVGKVESIEFLPEGQRGGQGATLKLTLSVAERALSAVRQDSKFYVNMAGIIGERYIEISPGSVEQPLLAKGATVRGIDPPRIDQLLSQGYGVFGKIQDFLDQNESTMTEFLGSMKTFLQDANRLLKGRDRTKLVGLIDNLYDISDDLKILTHRTKNPEFRQFLEQMGDIVDRAHHVDGPVIKKFFQDEGVRARIF